MSLAKQMLAAVLIATNAASMASAEVAPLVLQQGTPVALKTHYELDTQQMEPGDRFQFLLADHLTVNGIVVVPAGTPGVGEIVAVRHAGGFGRAGKIETRPLYVDYQGYHIELEAPLRVEGAKPRPMQHAYTHRHQGRTSAVTSGVVGTLLGGVVVGVVAAAFTKGPSGTVVADVPMIGLVHRTVRLTPAGTPATAFAAKKLLPEPGFSDAVALEGAVAMP